MNELIKRISATAALFNGRYEYREMHVVLQKMDYGVDIIEHTTKLKEMVEQFGCVSTYEIQIRESLLHDINELLSTLTNVQSSETKKNAEVGKTEGSVNISDEKNLDVDTNNDNKNDSADTGLTEQSATPNAVVTNPEVTDSKEDISPGGTEV